MTGINWQDYICGWYCTLQQWPSVCLHRWSTRTDGWRRQTLCTRRIDVLLLLESSIAESIHIHNRNVLLTTIGLTVTVQQNFSEFLSVSRGWRFCEDWREGTLYIENALFVFDSQAREKVSCNAIRCTNGKIVLFDASFCGIRSMTFVDAESSSI